MVESVEDVTMRMYEHGLRRMGWGALVIDAAGIIAIADPVIAGMLKISPGELVGRSIQDFLPTSLNPLTCSHLTCETAVRDDTGHERRAMISMRSLTGENATKKLICMMDLTDMEQANDALFHTQRLAGVGTLTASVAHELTNPLSIITATCSNLVHEVKNQNLDAEVLLHYIDMIEQSAWRSTRIVEVLRHYAHDRGLQTAVTSLKMIIEDALTLVRPQFAKEYGVTIHTELAPDLNSIVCDHNRLTQVLINLLGNARDAMQPQGGAIHIRSWAVHQQSGPTNGKSAGAAILGRPAQQAFSIRDEGAGITEGIKEQIFEPFFTTKPSGTGTGLGLFIAQGIVQEHNGRIWAENAPEGGAIFTVVLPQRSEQ